MGRAHRRINYVLSRLAQAVPIVLGIIVLDFVLLHLAPGNPAEALAGESGSATPQYMAMLRHEFGLDKPLYIQLALYIEHMLRLDLGYSFRDQMPVLFVILQRLWPTLLLMGTTLILSVGFGILFGLLAATRVNGWRDNIISVLVVVAYATPLFLTGIVLILFFSTRLHLLPATGMVDIAAFYQGWDYILDVGRHLLMPAFTLSLFYLALYTRLMRAGMLEQYGMDYVITARAKGLTDRAITLRHVLRNAVLPVVTMAGYQAGALIGGSVVVEAVFGWPGIGQLAFQSVFARDYNLLLAIFFLSACLVVVVNLAVDILYTFLDPRIDLA